MKLVQRIRKDKGQVVEREKLVRWFNRVLDNMADGDILLEFKPTERTDAQNKYYWVVIGMIAREVGVNPEELHEMMKEMFLPEREYIIFARKRHLSSTTDQNKSEMINYIDNVIKFATEQLNMVIPDIEEYKHN